MLCQSSGQKKLRGMGTFCSFLNYGSLEWFTAPKEGIGIWISRNREGSFIAGERTWEKWYNRIWWFSETQAVLRLDYFFSNCWGNMKWRNIQKQSDHRAEEKRWDLEGTMWWTVIGDRKASWKCGVGQTIHCHREVQISWKGTWEARRERTSLNLCHLQRKMAFYWVESEKKGHH